MQQTLWRELPHPVKNIETKISQALVTNSYYNNFIIIQWVHKHHHIHVHQGASGVARSLVLARHLLYASPCFARDCVT